MEESKRNNNSVKRIVVTSLVIGGLFGGLIGAVTGSLAPDYIAPWFKNDVLGQTEDQANTNESDTNTATAQRITVEEESETIDTVAKVTPAVGSIIVKQDLSKLYDLSQPSPFDLFFGIQNNQPQGEQQVAAGTGFIVSSDGYILTNKHVIDAQEANYTFITNDGKQYDAQLVDTDPFNDLAVMKIDAQDLLYAELGDSDSLVLGQSVIAIGNTLSEYPNTVTKGIISGQGRTITAGNSQGQMETIEEVIQTDAAINPGNSGGPLINLNGQVIGINTAVSQEGQLIGFAIPINVVKPAIESVQRSGRIIRPYLGIRYRIINSELAEANKLPVDYGALIVRSSTDELAVASGSPADKAGLEENDIILEINGQKITENNSLSKMMKRFNSGDSITLKVLHDGKEKEMKIILEEYPQ